MSHLDNFAPQPKSIGIMGLGTKLKPSLKHYCCILIAQQTEVTMPQMVPPLTKIPTPESSSQRIENIETLRFLHFGPSTRAYMHNHIIHKHHMAILN